MSNFFTFPLDEGYTRTQRHNDSSTGLYSSIPGTAYHIGDDWSNSSEGGAVYSIGAGTVVYAGAVSGFGPNYVVIEHELPDKTKVTSYYGHMKSKDVYDGQEVAAGDQIGTVGSEGIGTGPHLHYAIFLGNDAPVNDPGAVPYPDNDITEGFVDPNWFFQYVEANFGPPSFPEEGISETISFADAANEFGVADGSDVAELYLQSIFGSAISNVSYTGSENAAFLVSDFEIPDVDIYLEGGILLSSGGFPGPSNTESGFTVAHGTAGDAELDDVVQTAFPGAGATEDASVLEFDVFVDPDVDGIRFDIVFGSEEYPEFSNSSFVDVAAVWVDDNRDGNFEVGENKALFNGSVNTPLSVLDENVALNFVDNEDGAYAIEWDGFAALSVRPELQEGWNSIKIAVADTGDQAFDSAIYVTNFEFLTGGATGPDIFKVVNGAVGRNDLQASETKEEFNLAEGSGSVSGTLKELSGDVITGFTEQIKLIIEQINLLKEWVKITFGSANLGIDENGDGVIDGTITLEGDFEGAEFNVNVVGENTEITVDLPSENAPPVAVDDAFSVDEVQTLFGNVLDDNGNGADSDPDGDALTVSLISGPAEGILTLSDDGSFSYEADSGVFDLATPGEVIEQSFTYQIDDGNGEVDQATATISVTILDDLSLAAITDQAVDENSPAGTVVATAVASDPDGDVLTYSLGGDDASAFTIDAASGEISLAFSPDFEAPADADGDNRYALIVTAEDPEGASATENFEVEVLDVNEAPVLAAITDQAVDENSPAGTVIATAAASDPDGDVLTYSLGGDDASAFTIDAASGEISLAFSPDFEAPADADGDNRYDLDVTATDPGGASATENFTLEILDVAENRFAGAVLPPPLVEDMALLYEAALDRQPDVPGLNYFVGDLRQGQSLHDVANTFYRSSEFRSQFSEFDNESYIDQLYQNVLDRQADQPGLDYWITDIEDRGRSHADVLVSFARSQENRDNAEWLSGLSFDESSDSWLI
ncbi:choice-of-anchor L domain-containing protein [Halomonas tibetensis]|uniref:Choice-of-anchor L domain-containing protein n=1 Tax=Halomonas tibetensis TaxID=2259590 RepID=A0ABV7B6S5_9GAMM